MARIVEFRSSEQPHMSITESMYYRLAEPLVFRDLDGVLGDIVAACCRRCGEVTLRSDEVANHLCISSERTERLVENGKEAFRAIVDRKQSEDRLATLQQRVERLTDWLEACEAWITHVTAITTERDIPSRQVIEDGVAIAEQARALLRAAEGGER